MHSDDHILEHFLAAKHPLPALAAHLGMTLIALIQWVDRNADLLATAKRAMEAHLAFLALKAEAAALIELTSVSSSTTNEERKRKSSSQLLRHSAKRLLTNPTRERGAPCASATPFAPPLASTQRARSVSDGPSAHSLTNLAGSLDCSDSPASPRSGGEKVASTEGARGMRGTPSAPLTNPTRERGAPCASASSPPLLNQLASPPSPRLNGEKVPSTEGARRMRGSESAPSTTRERGAPCASASTPSRDLATTPPIITPIPVRQASVPSASSRVIASAGAAPPIPTPSLISEVFAAIEDLTPRRPHSRIAI